MADGPLRQFLLFALVGGVAAVVHYGTLVALAELFRVAPVPASAAGFLVGGVVSYLLNYGHVFRSEQDHGPTAAKFVAVAAVGLGLNSAIMWALVHGVSLHYLLAQVTATGLVMLWSFAANRYWTFSAGAGSSAS
ncbi:GtrA family protein [Azospirillum agricola]|uniref:GtrA family protein n=1 Tax=Azospirillum agricola TaxID=1720247 RepID=UPI000A0EFC1F|nr:GtrA family protein [Azospirillum agricola]SMH44193.1 Putative flippase GtrA (transmembrane translocase of bactoprenol-linked glucose) [Azospirillum lipoferum]